MFTPEQIKKLLASKYVVRCSPKSITYRQDFKVWAVKKYFNEGYSPNRIFEEAGFDLRIIGRSRPKERLRFWRKKYGLKGSAGLKKDDRGKYGGRKKELRFKNDQEKIKYLEAKIAYMDAENDFLAKLRGLKRE
jgi:hypothetical protein